MNEETEKRVKNTLDKYYRFCGESEKLPVADAYERLQSIAEDFADILTDLVWYE